MGAERKDETSIDDVNYYASTNDSAERAEDANFGGLGSPLLLWEVIVRHCRGVE